MKESAKIKISWDGKTYEIDCNPSETILEAALRHEIDAPFSCLSGTCNACQAHLNKGQVEMNSYNALTEDEIAAGEILTCQAHPTSSEIEISYDDPDD